MKELIASQTSVNAMVALRKKGQHAILILLTHVRSVKREDFCSRVSVETICVPARTDWQETVKRALRTARSGARNATLAIISRTGSV
jgi:hypothetical protein